MTLRGFRVSEGSKHGLLVPSIGQIISAGSVSMPSSLNGDGTYGVDIDLPASYPTSDIGVIVQARDFSWCRKINVAGVNPSAESGNASLYAQNATRVTNGVTGVEVTQAQGSSEVSVEVNTAPDQIYISYAFVTTQVTIDVLHADGSVTNLGTAVATQTINTSASRNPETVEGQYAVNWSCPETTLVITDALKFTWSLSLTAYNLFFSGPGSKTVSSTITFVTPRLGWTKLNAATWSISRWQHARHDGNTSPGYSYGRLYWGSSSKEVKISGVNYEAPVNQDYWGQFFADSGKNYYTKNLTTGVMTLWTPGAMTYGSPTTWDPILNISPLCGWDKGDSPTDKVRLFASIGYGIYDSSAAEAIIAHTIGSDGISEVDYAIFLKNYGGE
jgi:hypothetical protein